MAAAAVRKPSQWLDKLQMYANTINHMLIAIICVYTSWMCYNLGPTNYTLHTWLTTIGVRSASSEGDRAGSEPNLKPI